MLLSIECKRETVCVVPPVIAIDPGTTHSGLVVWSPTSDRVLFSSAKIDNGALLSCLVEGSIHCGVPSQYCHYVIEMIASYGMAVGKETFETCVWIGRFLQAIQHRTAVARRLFRKDVKLHLCHTMRAKDANIRQALIDRFGPPGTKANPGRLYGVTSHAWAALALAVTYGDTHAAL